MSSDLRAVLEAVLDEPLVEPRPVEHVMRRGKRIVAHRRRRRTLTRFGVLVLLTTLGLQWVVLDSGDDRVRITGGPDLPVESSTTSTTTAVNGPVPFHDAVTAEARPPTGFRPAPRSPAASRRAAPSRGTSQRCDPSRNRSSDLGVSATSVRVGVSVDLVYGVRAAVDRVNRRGGVCGRSIELAVGAAGEAVFATAEPHDATPPLSLARIAADHAYRDLGARSFAVVYERTYSSAAEALAEYVKTLPEAALRASQLVDGNVADEAAAVAVACGGRCDAVLLALGPATTTEWLKADGPTATRETAALPSVLAPSWPHDCLREAGERCREVAVWTPYRLPGASPQNSDLDEYERDARMLGHDPADGAFQAAYVGMRALAAAMEQLGSDLTRDRLRAALARGYESGMVGPRATAREMRMEVKDGRFLGWRDVSERWHHDPQVTR